MDEHDATCRRVAGLLREAERVLFVTGAGISADSGLPTYRGVGGLYEETGTEEGVPIEDAISGAMLRSRPALAWKYLWQIGSTCAGAAPNDAHRIIAEFETEKAEVRVLTQNIDGLHRAAGTSDPIEVHGRMSDLYCTGCGRAFPMAEFFAELQRPPELPPSCPVCAGPVRPRVVLFGEYLFPSVLRALDELAATVFDLVFAVGTTGLFPYIQQPLALARLRGTPTVEINPSPTPLSSSFDYRLPLGAAEALRRLRGA